MFNLFVEKAAEPVRWLLIILIAYTLAMVILRFFETPVVAPAINQAERTNTTVQRPPPNVNAILAKNLFGVEGAAPPTQQQQTTSTKTRLPLELQSVFVADEPELSTAIVAQKGKGGRMYRVGDKIPGNAELVEVAHDQIFLRRAGVRESLPFPKSSAAVSFQAELVEDPSVDQTATEDVYDDEPPTEQQASLDEPEPDYRQQLEEDAEGTLDELGIETAEGGGYKIGNSIADKYLQQTGLQTGDVVLSINGQPVGNIQQDKMQLDSILAQGSARIEVQRGSRRFFVTARLPN